MNLEKLTKKQLIAILQNAIKHHDEISYKEEPGEIKWYIQVGSFKAIKEQVSMYEKLNK